MASLSVGEDDQGEGTVALRVVDHRDKSACRAFPCPLALTVPRDVSTNVSVSSPTAYMPGLAADGSVRVVVEGGVRVLLSPSDPLHDAAMSAMATTRIPRRIRCQA
jgi:hypothetical protein